MKIKLIAIDMDGTLLSNKKTISTENIQAIKEATAKGHVIMLCSGRSHEDVLSFLEKYELSLPFAGSNGSIVYADEQKIHCSAMNLESAASVFHYLETEKLPFQIYTNKGVFKEGSFFRKAIKAYLTAPKIALPPLPIKHILSYRKKVPSTSVRSFDELRCIEGLEIYKFFIFTPHPEKKEDLLHSIEGLDELTITSSSPDNVEITGLNGHKGNAVMEMANYYNIPIEDTVAIGDNLNDASMMQVAGLSIAMGNAEEEVKELCDVTTLTNEEDGVAYAIHKYILEDEMRKSRHYSHQS